MLVHINTRQSDRGYSDQPVEKEKIERILEAGRLAPSACNSQPWKFIVVDDHDLRKEIAAASSAKALGFNKFTDQVPVFIVIIREKSNPVVQIGGTIKDKDYCRVESCNLPCVVRRSSCVVYLSFPSTSLIRLTASTSSLSDAA